MHIRDILEIMMLEKRNAALKATFKAIRGTVIDMGLPLNVFPAKLVSYEVDEYENTIFYGIKVKFNRLPSIDILKADLDLHIDEQNIIII